MYIASLIDHYEVFSIKIGTDSELFLSMITISCGVMASDLNCTIRWVLFGITQSHQS